jgi:hypothetical protein
MEVLMGLLGRVEPDGQFRADGDGRDRHGHGVFSSAERAALPQVF